MARGFASLSPAARAEVSRRGGRAAHALGKAHVFTPGEARAAGAKGGAAAGVSRAQARSLDAGVIPASIEIVLPGDDDLGDGEED